MIHLLAYNVRDALSAQKFPIRVEYGPEAFDRERTASLVVLHREGESDQFSAPSAPGRNPRNFGNQAIGFAALVFAKDSSVGATRGDHEVLCDVFVKALVCALHKAAATQANQVMIGAGHLLTRTERAGSKFERFPGVVYELKAALLQGVQDFDWTGAGRETIALKRIFTELETVTTEGNQYVGYVDVD